MASALVSILLYNGVSGRHLHSCFLVCSVHYTALSTYRKLETEISKTFKPYGLYNGLEVCWGYVSMLNYDFALRRDIVEMNKNLSLIFVYGTLKREQPNNYRLSIKENGYSNFLGTGKTVEQYPLVIATKYNIPFLLSEPGVGNKVFGEIYEVDNKMLTHLDILEEHPNFYERHLERIDCEFESKKVDCWTYFLKNFRRELLNLKMYESYNPSGIPGLKFWDNPDPNYDYKTAVKNV